MFIDTLLTLWNALTFAEILRVMAVSVVVVCLLFVFLVIFLKCHMAIYGDNNQGADALDANVEKWKTMNYHHDYKDP